MARVVRVREEDRRMAPRWVLGAGRPRFDNVRCETLARNGPKDDGEGSELARKVVVVMRR
jgi:hypothetical protein